MIERLRKFLKSYLELRMMVKADMFTETRRESLWIKEPMAVLYLVQHTARHHFTLTFILLD